MAFAAIFIRLVGPASIEVVNGKALGGALIRVLAAPRLNDRGSRCARIGRSAGMMRKRYRFLASNYQFWQYARREHTAMLILAMSFRTRA